MECIIHREDEGGVLVSFSEKSWTRIKECADFSASENVGKLELSKKMCQQTHHCLH